MLKRIQIMVFEHKARHPLESSEKKTSDKDKVITVTAFLGYPEKVLNTVEEIASKNIQDRRHWSRQELAQESNMGDFIAVEKFATENNLKNHDASISARTIKLTGKVSDFEKAFDIKIVAYTHPRGDYITYEGTVKLPDFIHSVHGLDTRRIAEPHFRDHFLQTTPSYVSNAVAKAYQFPAGTGAGQTIAIIELGGGFMQNDLNNYFANISHTSQPVITAVSVDGANNIPNPASGDDVEVELDIEVPGSVATGAKYCVYFAPNTDQGFIDAISQATHDSVNKPSIISISWGGPEQSWSSASIQAMGQVFQAAAALGISVFAASGDNGNKDDGRTISVDYPASDPFVCACGATNITSLSPLTETGWQYAGGGASTIFAIPSWQSSVPGIAGSKRVVPDVAALGGTPGFTVTADGKTGAVEGTSCVTPLFAGLTAILNQMIGKPIGYVNPLFYKQAKAFNDIIVGSNGFSCAPGWDPVTGLGSPNGVALLAALQGTSPPTPTPTPTPTPVTQTRYQLRSTQQKGEPTSWKVLFDSGQLS